MSGAGVISRTLQWQVHQSKSWLGCYKAQSSWVNDLTFHSASISSLIDENTYVVIFLKIKYYNRAKTWLILAIIHFSPPALSSPTPSLFSFSQPRSTSVCISFLFSELIALGTGLSGALPPPSRPRLRWPGGQGCEVGSRQGGGSPQVPLGTRVPVPTLSQVFAKGTAGRGLGSPPGLGHLFSPESH